jgi:hypothetical protein
MLHRHLTRERYEQALEDSSSKAARHRRRAETCPRCSAALADKPLAPLLAAWVVPASTARPADWEVALRRAIAPSARRARRRWSRPRTLLAATVAVAALLLISALPVAGGTGPESALYPVRGLEEDVRWQLTPEPDRAALEADLASAYLWQARTAAARHDAGAYRASMQRFFRWAGRLHTDIAKAPPAQRATARDSVSADLSLVSPLTSSGPDPAAARRAQSMMRDVESEGSGGHDQENQHGDGGQGSGASDRSQSDGR